MGGSRRSCAWELGLLVIKKTEVDNLSFLKSLFCLVEIECD